MAEEKKALAAIGYIPPLFWIPLFLSGGDDLAKYHGRQALVIFVVWLLTFIVFSILIWFFNLIKLSPIRLVFQLASGILYIVYLIISIVAAVKAANGERWRIPVLGAYSDRLKI